jgi:hypothetical protein
VGGREKPGKSREKSGKSQEKSGTLRRLLSPAKFTSVLPGYRESGLEHELALSFYVRKRFPSPLARATETSTEPHPALSLAFGQDVCEAAVGGDADTNPEPGFVYRGNVTLSRAAYPIYPKVALGELGARQSRPPGERE